jgi:hypothetical protein
MSTNSDDELAGDLLSGIGAIAQFTGLPERSVYYMVNRGQLPGVFQAGRKSLALKSELEAGLRDRARSGIKSSSKIEGRECAGPAPEWRVSHERAARTSPEPAARAGGTSSPSD